MTGSTKPPRPKGPGVFFGGEMKNVSLKKAALIAIDMQRYFLEPGERACIEGAKKIIPNIASLMNEFHIRSKPVIFTRHGYEMNEDTGMMGKWWEEKLPMLEDDESHLIEEMNPAPADLIIIKKSYSAFHGTELDTILKKNDTEALVICGVMTNLCVETTARHAFMLGYQPIVVSDACAAKNMQHHEAALLNLSYGFSPTPTTGELLKWF